MVLSSSLDGAVKLWHVGTGLLVRSFRVDAAAARQARFSGDGKYIISAHGDHTIRFWDIATGQYIKCIDATITDESSFDISPDNKILAISSGIHLETFDIETGHEIQDWIAHKDSIPSVVLMPDGQRILTASYDHAVKIWDIDDKKLLHRFLGHKDLVTAAITTPDGGRIISGDLKGTIFVWDASTERQLRQFQAPKQQGVSSLAVSPDGVSIIVGTNSGEILSWNIENGSLQFNKNANRCITTVAFSSDGQMFLTGSDDQTITLWRAADGSEIRVLSSQMARARKIWISPNGERLFATSFNSWHLWDLKEGRLLRSEKIEFNGAQSVSFPANGSSIFVAGGRGIERRELGTGELARQGKPESVNRQSSVQLSRNGRRALLRPYNETEGVRVWDVYGRAEVNILRGIREVDGIELAPDGTRLLWTSSRDALRLVDVAEGKTIQTLSRTDLNPRELFGPHSLFSNNGSTIVTTLGSRLLWWDLTTGKARLSADEIGTSFVSSLAFSFDGRLVVCGDQSGTIGIWDSGTGKVLRKIKTKGGSVEAVTFSPDGHRVWSADNDGVVRLWDIASGQVVITLSLGESGAWLAMTPAGFFNRGGEGNVPIALVRGMEAFSVDQVFDHLYRPDLVQELLKGDREGKYKDAAHNLNLETLLDSGPPPQIEHVADKDDRVGDGMRISIRVTDKGGGVGKRIVWRVNGVAQGEPAPVALATADAPLASVLVTEILKLVPGQVNVVEVVAYNRAGLVATPPLKISIDKFGATTEERPRMFVLALGIDQYRMKEYQLSYAAHDARTLVKALEQVGGSLFAEVKARTLTNTEVTENGISIAIEAIAREAKPEDVFVLFLGGHGKSVAGRYYYYPQTLEFDEGHTVEAQAIGQEKWEAWLARIAAQKSLLVVDTCEGDAFRGSRGADAARQTAIAQLQHATGRNVIAASRDAAYEGYQGHGVLTYAILEALQKGSSSAGDDRIRVTSLADYVSLRVPEISQKSFGVLQSPTRKLTGNDFPIGVRQPVLAAAGEVPVIPYEPTHVLIRAELLRDKPATEAQGSRTLLPGSQVRAVEFEGVWVIVARDGQKLGYVPVEALARLQ